MKLYDKLLKTKLTVGNNDAPGVQREMRRLLKDATRYRVNEIAQYYWEHPDTGGWALDNPDFFPSLRPAGRVAWMEYEMPKRIMMEGMEEPKYNPLQGSLIGGLFNVIDRGMEEEDVGHLFAKAPKQAYWLSHLYMYYWPRGKDTAYQVGFITTGIDEEGQMTWQESKPYSYVSIVETGESSANETLADAVAQWSKPFFLACSLLSADNVETVFHQPQSRGKRKAKKDFTPYNTLTIYPAKKRHRGISLNLSQSGRQGENGSRKPLIGHFRRYGYAGRGLLFGKYKCILYIEGKPDDIDREVKWTEQ